MANVLPPGIRRHKAEQSVDALARVLISQISCDCVLACCDCLSSHATAIIRRVDLLGEPLDQAATALGLDTRQALALLEQARWAAAQTVVLALTDEPLPASGISECGCEAQ